MSNGTFFDHAIETFSDIAKGNLSDIAKVTFSDTGAYFAMTGSFRTEKFSTFPDVFFLETVEKMSMFIILFILMPDNNHQDHPILVCSQVTGYYTVFICVPGQIFPIDWLSWGLTTHQYLWVILCSLPETGGREIIEMKERDREEKKMNDSEETDKNIPPLLYLLQG